MSVLARTKQVPVKSDPRVTGPPRSSTAVDLTRLKRDLRRAVRGEVRFDPGSIAMYANDASNFRQVPVGVVVPRTLATALVHGDEDAAGIATKGFKGKLAEVKEHLPGAGS